VRKDSLIGLVDALKSRNLTPSNFQWDADGNLVGLQVQQLAEPEAEPAQPAPKPLTFRPVSAISSLGKSLPTE
jgi:hypothetical protein